MRWNKEECVQNIDNRNSQFQNETKYRSFPTLEKPLLKWNKTPNPQQRNINHFEEYRWWNFIQAAVAAVSFIFPILDCLSFWSFFLVVFLIEFEVLSNISRSRSSSFIFYLSHPRLRLFFVFLSFWYSLKLYPT